MKQQKMIDGLQYHAHQLSEVADAVPEAAPYLIEAADLIQEAVIKLTGVVDVLDDTVGPLAADAAEGPMPSTGTHLIAAEALRGAVQRIDAAPVQPSRVLRVVVDAAGDIEAMLNGPEFTDRNEVTR